MSELPQCLICQDQFRNGQSMSIIHVNENPTRWHFFHTPCVEELSKSFYGNMCPNCRTEIMPSARLDVKNYGKDVSKFQMDSESEKQTIIDFIQSYTPQMALLVLPEQTGVVAGTVAITLVKFDGVSAGLKLCKTILLTFTF